MEKILALKSFSEVTANTTTLFVNIYSASMKIIYANFKGAIFINLSPNKKPYLDQKFALLHQNFRLFLMETLLQHKK